MIPADLMSVARATFNMSKLQRAGVGRGRILADMIPGGVVSQAFFDLQNRVMFQALKARVQTIRELSA